MTEFYVDSDGTVRDPLPEVWEDIPGYEGFYRISNHGRVMSVPRRVRTDRNGAPGSSLLGGKIISLQAAGSGRRHMSAWICRDGVEEAISVARLVAFLWVDGYEPGLVVGHFDGDTSNNRADNLYWKRPGRQKPGRWIYAL